MQYTEFLDKKLHSNLDSGFAPLSIPDFLFDFQKSLVEWSCLKGRGALYCDTGMGKTAMQLVWADNVARKTGGKVLIITPLAVSHQTKEEGEKFGIECGRSSIGLTEHPITITNYERLKNFDPARFSGVVCDESAILKSFDGHYRSQITEFMRKIPYRLLCTATAAPNDYVELGTSSEALGYLGHIDMLGRFFKNDNNNVGLKRHFGEAPKWRFKGHAETPFWRWVSSWARAMRKPSDLGFDDGPFKLPPLIENEHIVKTKGKPDGMLFNLPAHTLREQREERRRSLIDRCEYMAGIAESGLTGSDGPVILWCHLNDEGNLLEELLPGSVQVSGNDSSEKKEEALIGFARGQIKTLITKPKIGAWGLNFQRCHRIVMFPSHSFEQYYQAVRRCWRFGQKHPVTVDIVLAEGETRVLANLRRKAEQADRMFDALVREMQNAQAVTRANNYTEKGLAPAWL